jgi:Na+/H+ antiporter NhaD/arsenite permease-like protein
MNKYFIEFVGVLIILFAKVLTEAEPVVMAMVYFSVFHIARNITSGYFNPLGAIAVYGLGRTSFNDMLNNILAQGAAVVAFLIAYTPIHKLIKD